MMSYDSPGVEMLDIQNAIDSEFEVAKVTNVCSRSTKLLFSRMDALSGKQLELRNILESLDAELKKAEELQLRNNSPSLPEVSSMPTTSTSTMPSTVPLFDRITGRSSTSDSSPNYRALPENRRPRSESTERKIVSGAKESPIVIDDEEDVFSYVVSQNSKTPTNESAPPPADVRSVLPSSQYEERLFNAKRRSLILEKMPDNQIFSAAASAPVARTSSSAEPLALSSVVHKEISLVNTTDRRLSTSEAFQGATSDTFSSRMSSSESVRVSTPSNSGGYGSSTDSAISSINEGDPPRTASAERVDVMSPSSFPVSGGRIPAKERVLRHTEVRQPTVSPTITKRPHSPSDFKVGSRVLGKRSSDIWFPGEIIKTIPDRNKQTKYSVKYDKGQKGVLSLNHICPEAPATVEDLSVGSRVVGLYGRLDIWYAGIVAEMPCGDNRNRFLVFFDDGFAQYLSAKKLHKVHHKGKNVWEDVTEHSRDFIQEYLEEYPSRPMLHVRVGQWIRTEWMGEWLKAKVLSVDGSLVKMLFQIDNRSEWIYRGSTRLDPLYRALVLGEKTTSGKARSRKLTRNASSRGNTPYIEYNITKASFGISPYSKTDPKGIQQLQLEEQRKLTQLQQQPQQDTNDSKQTTTYSEAAQQNKIRKPMEKIPKQKETECFSNAGGSFKPLPTAVQKQDRTPAQAPVIASTYSCIEASTLRKRTGASLVISGVFKPVDTDVVQSPALVSPTLKVPSVTSTSIPPPPPSPTKKTVDEKKQKGRNGQWKAPWLNREQRNKQRHLVVKAGATTNANKPRDVASILKNKLDANVFEIEDNATTDFAPSSKLKPESISVAALGPHTCSSACTQSQRAVPIDQLRHNPLAMPILLDWKREIVKRRGKTNKRDVYYRTPCHRRLRSMAEVLNYLTLTRETELKIDQFTFDWRIRTRDMSLAPAIVDDISNGLENRPLPAVNEVDNSRPPDVQYVSERQLAPEVRMSRDPEFMICCDCEGICSDSSKCACIQLTLQGCKVMDGKENDKGTYQYRRLRDCIQTGIYECNPQCSCTKNCLNRVVQNGIQMRMEVFKTENRGWGLRAVDDIPAGTFICTYAGYLLNEELANQEGRDFGDEYMAELDYIEVAEKAKEGYESGVSDLEEDDNVINEMLQFDENLSGSENSVSYGDRSSCRNEDLDDEDDDEGDEEEDEDDDEEDVEDDENDSSTSDNCSLSSGDENSFRERRKTLRSSKPKKVYKSQQKKKRGTISEESLVVERESKARVLSRMSDPLMCIMALKRNGNDLKRSAQFLRKLVEGHDLSPESLNGSEKYCKQVNGLSTRFSGDDQRSSRVPSSSDFDLDDLSDDTLAAIHTNTRRSNSDNNNASSMENSDREHGEMALVDENECASMSLMEILENKDDQTSSTNNMSEEEDNFIGVTKEDAPELLSADDLRRLAASQPKSVEPPVLLKAGETRRGTILDETIEKLKKRVVASDSNFLGSDETQGTPNANRAHEASVSVLLDSTSQKHELSKDVDDENTKDNSLDIMSRMATFTGEKEADITDDEKRSVRSESSLVSRNSSSLTQSASSRCSSPAVDMMKDFAKNSGKKQGERRTSKDGKSETTSSVPAKHVKTRSLFGEEHCYVIDAKTFGNCGRFLNHSCSPNLFVQNVFVDTHDLRFPWVAFFAQQNIKSGSELNWDYMYEVGSVRDKVLHCLCGSSECRGRLL